MNFRTTLFTLVIASTGLSPAAQAMDVCASPAEVCSECMAPNRWDDCKNTGLNPLHVACGLNHITCIQALLANEVRWFGGQEPRWINQQDSSGCTPLHYAAGLNHTAALQALLDAEADINVRDEFGRTALFCTCYWDHTDCQEAAKLLINHDADVTIPSNNGDTTLRFAAQYGYSEIVQLLIARGAKVNHAEVDGWTPLYGAILNNHIEIAELLIKSDADVNTQDKYRRTPLHLAVEHGHIEAIKLLLRYGANINKQDCWGKTPLFVAIEGSWHARVDNERRIKVVQTLIDAGANPTIRANDYPFSPLNKAISKGYAEIANMIHRAEFNFNARTTTAN